MNCGDKTDAPASRPGVLALVLGSGLGTGFIPVAPATFATLVTLPLVWVLPKSIVIYGSFTILLFVVGVMLATRLEATWGRDARRITIDELVGTLVTFAGVPLSLGSALAGFVLFRFFDIVKLPAVRACERLPGGWGIVADDVAAGICANAVLQLVFRVLLHLPAASWRFL